MRLFYRAKAAEQAADTTAGSAARAARPPEQADADRAAGTAAASARRQARCLGRQGPRLVESSSPLYHPLQPVVLAKTAASSLNLLISSVLHSQPLMQDPLSLSQLGQQPLGPADDYPGISLSCLPLTSPATTTFATPPAEPVDTAAAEMVLNLARELNMPIGPVMQEVLGPVPTASSYEPIGDLRYHFLALCLLHNPTWTIVDLFDVAEHVVNADALGGDNDLVVWLEELVANHHDSLGLASARFSQLSPLQSQQLQQQQ